MGWAAFAFSLFSLCSCHIWSVVITARSKHGCSNRSGAMSASVDRICQANFHNKILCLSWIFALRIQFQSKEIVEELPEFSCPAKRLSDLTEKLLPFEILPPKCFYQPSAHWGFTLDRMLATVDGSKRWFSSCTSHVPSWVKSWWTHWRFCAVANNSCGKEALFSGTHTVLCHMS